MNPSWLSLALTVSISGLSIPAATGYGQQKADTAVRARRSPSSETPGRVVRDIAGVWEGTFRLDSAWRLPGRATARSAPARVRFANPGEAPAGTLSARSVHPGNFEIDFTRFGFELATHDALGWSADNTTIRGILNPAVDRGMVELHGTVRGDTIVGTWRFVSDPGGANGTFDLHRIGGAGRDADSSAARATTTGRRSPESMAVRG